MNKLEAVLISGWAVPASALQPLASQLDGISKVHLVSLSELGATSSEYGSGLIQRVRKLAGPVVLIGWSTGGMVALEAAAELGDAVSGLLLISTTARFCAGPDYSWGVPVSHVRVMSKTIGPKPEETLQKFFTDVALPHADSPETMAEHIHAAQTLGLAALAEGLKYLQHADLRSRIGCIRVPCLILHGRQDAIIPWQAGQYLQDSIPGSYSVLYDGIGHDLPVRQPATVARTLSVFLKEYC